MKRDVMTADNGNMQKGIVDPRYVRASVRRVLSLVLGSPRFKRLVQEGAK